MDEPEKKSWRKFIIAAAAVVLVMTVLTIMAWPYIRQLNDPETRRRFTGWIESLGLRGILILLGIQFVQIVVAFIPGGPIELAAGAAYGTFGGLLICLIGSIIASTLIFAVVRRFGASLVERFFKKESLDKYEFLKDTKKIEQVTFILFLIPGTPKDMLTYAAGLSRIGMLRFMVIANFARIPAILVATMMGDTMIRGHWYIFLLIFVLTALTGILGIRYQDRIVNFFRKKEK